MSLGSSLILFPALGCVFLGVKFILREALTRQRSEKLQTSSSRLHVSQRFLFPNSLNQHPRIVFHWEDMGQVLVPGLIIVGGGCNILVSQGLGRSSPT